MPFVHSHHDRVRGFGGKEYALRSDRRAATPPVRTLPYSCVYDAAKTEEEYRMNGHAGWSRQGALGDDQCGRRREVPAPS